MSDEQMSTEHPTAVQDAEKRFNDAVSAGRFKKLKGRFYWLLENFRDGVTEAAICRRTGVGRHSISSIYEMFFRELCGNVGGKTRSLELLKIAAIKKGEKAARSNKALRAITEKAKRFECLVEYLHKRYSSEIMLTRIRINGHLCAVVRCGSSFGQVSLARTMTQEVHSILFYSRVRGSGTATVHVVPAGVISEKYFNKKSRRQASITFPPDGIYKEAWHLLPPQR